MLVLKEVVADREEVVGQTAVPAGDQAMALDMAKQVEVEPMLAEVVVVEVEVEVERTVDPDMVLGQALGMDKLVDMDLTVEDMLKEEVVVKVEAVDKMVGPDMVLALDLDMVKQEDMVLTMEDTLRLAAKVVVVGAGKMDMVVAQAVDLEAPVDTHKIYAQAGSGVGYAQAGGYGSHGGAYAQGGGQGGGGGGGVNGGSGSGSESGSGQDSSYSPGQVLVQLKPVVIGLIMEVDMLKQAVRVVAGSGWAKWSRRLWRIWGWLRKRIWISF
ncbi:hypothetical protein GUJ93_ZPchr0012g21971 [Zizania palustris]|uniref:Uncharacterized protein n=1 Tax=Zizania palustris TaxID=103762 RepID=A0A8J5WND3_ZIZPA|nr:hypothetical protein GUJ93_ZPchr0012g21971 [Zizania palustris]